MGDGAGITVLLVLLETPIAHPMMMMTNTIMMTMTRTLMTIRLLAGTI
jgi:hypothetical protein